MNRSYLQRAIMLVLGLGMGCTGGGSTNNTADTVTQTVGVMGAEITVSAAGNPTIAGTTLLIPAGALAQDTPITVTVGSEIAQSTSSESGAGPSVRFSPDGLVFAKPATLTLPFAAAKQPSGSSLAVDYSSVNGRGQYAGSALTIDRNAGTVSVDIAHFTDYEVVATTGDTTVCNKACIQGYHCANGNCVPDVTDGGTGHDGGPTDGGLRDGSSGLHDGSTSAHDGSSAPHDASGPHDGGAGDLP